jgi:hypothetical protein
MVKMSNLTPMSAGTWVWFLDGYSAPVLLRPREEGKYEFCDHAYIQGLMRGEAFPDPGPWGKASRRISLLELSNQSITKQDKIPLPETEFYAYFLTRWGTRTAVGECRGDCSFSRISLTIAIKAALAGC